MPLPYQIERHRRQKANGPLLSARQMEWLCDLFDGLGEGFTDMARNHPKHGNTVKALLQLAQALRTSDEGDRRSSLETAIGYAQDALAGKPLTHHLDDAADAVAAKAAAIVADNKARRTLTGAEYEGR